MTDTDQQLAPPHRPRRVRRLIGAAALVCVLAVLVALTLWSARPRWYTFVSGPVGMFHPLALSIRVPDGWYCLPDVGFSPYIGKIAVLRRHLTGLSRWWSEHVFRLGSGQSTDERYAIFLAPEISLHEGVSATYYKRLGYQTTERTYEHALGSAHIFTAVWHRPGFPPAVRMPVGMADAGREDTVITVRDRPYTTILARHDGTSASFSRDQSTWDEIVRNIRVIQK